MSDQRTIRAWARANGYPVAVQGPVSAVVRAAYESQTPAAARPAVVRPAPPAWAAVACWCGGFTVRHADGGRAGAEVQLRVHQAVKHPASAGVAA